MPRAGFQFGTTRNPCPYSLWYVIVIFVFALVFLGTIVLNLLLTYILLGLFASTLYNCRVIVSNYELHVLLFSISVLSFFPYLKLLNSIYYTNIITRSFSLAIKSFLELFSCSSESLIFDRSSFARDTFWANLRGLVLVSRVLQCFLHDEASEPFYYVINFIAWNNLRVRL